MTMTCCNLEYYRNFVGFHTFGSQQRLNEEDGPILYSLLNVLFSGVYITLISQGVHPLGASNKGWVRQLSIFRANVVYVVEYVVYGHR